MAIPLSSNNLLTTPEAFSEIACLDGRLFGVETPCDSCTTEFNDCVRRRLVQNLVSNQGRVEREVGYNITSRYHAYEFKWDGKPMNVQLDWPGIEEINVIQATEVLEGVTEVSPYVLLDVEAEDSGEGFCTVELDKVYIENPAHAIIRDADSLEVYPQQDVNGYPHRNDDGNWIVALGKPALPTSCPTVHVQNCKYIVAIRETPECDGDIYAVRKDTEIIIPFAKEPTVDGGNTIYWFRPWSLVDEAFFDDVVDLEAQDFYKLVQEIEFICITSEESLPIVTQADRCNCSDTLEEDSELINISILYASKGIVRITYTDRSCCLARCKSPIKIKVFYKTNPNLVVEEGSLLALQEAIAYLTAAELQTSSCGCKVETGFIADAQTTFADLRVNPITGETVANITFGSLKGQLIFAEKLSKAYRFKKSIKL